MASAKKDQAVIAYAKTLENVPWCEDYERMVSGMLYDAQVPELATGRFRARRLMHKYNSHFPDDATEESLAAYRLGILKESFGHVGEDVYIEPPLRVDYGCNISVGDRFYANFGLVILDCGMVKIGSRVMCANNVSILAATHETGVQSRRDNIEYAKSVEIGDDCWVGANVSIMPGVKVGKGCTIGAGAVVTKDIPDFSVAVGAPAKVIKKVEPVPDL